MALTSEQMAEVVAELKQIGSELNLSDGQKEQLKTALTQAREKLQQYKQENPNATKEQLLSKIAANRSAIRERVVAFLTPEQLGKWDTAVAKINDSMDRKAASA